MNKFKILAISVFLMGIVSAGITYGIQSSNTEANGVKVLYIVTAKNLRDGSSRITGRKYRLQKPDGSWREIITYINPDGSVNDIRDTFAINGRGIYLVNEKNKQLHFRSEKSPMLRSFSASDVINSKQFGGEFQILGYQTLLENIPNGNDFGQVYSAPALNGLALKYVTKIGDNIFTEEASEVNVGPISNAEFGTLPNYPVNYNSYKKQADIIESTGDKARADQMRSIIPPDQR